MWPFLFVLACGKPTPSPADDDLDDDGFDRLDDCDDADARTFPGAAESGDGADRDCDGRVPPPPLEVAGTDADGGFGHAVALRGDLLLVGAPFAGASLGALPAGSATGISGAGGEAWPGAYGAARGGAVGLLSDGTPLIGEPGAGALRTLEGTLVYAEAGIGGALAVRDTDWAVRTRDGAVRADGARFALGRPADALALLPDGSLALGFASGEVALALGDARVLRARAADGAGRALAVGDADADGDTDLLVGAPEAGRVYLLDPSALPASLDAAPYVEASGGRFGAALAVHEPGDWFVGAPVAGTTAEGAVYRVKDGEVTPFLQGAAAGEQLGYALAASDDALAVGAPGASGTTGRVLRVVP